MLSHNKLQHQRGDTLVEVLLAIGVLSAIVILSMQIMNRATANAQIANETTITRQRMDGQAEMLRYLHSLSENEDNAQWNDIKGKIKGAATAYGNCPNTGATTPGKSFFIDRANTSDYALSVKNYDNNAPNPIPKPNEGIWIEAVGNDGGGNPYIDFHIRACWDPPAGGGPKLTQGTVVRIYDQAN